MDVGELDIDVAHDDDLATGSARIASRSCEYTNVKVIDVVGEELAVALRDGADAMLADGECVVGGQPPGLRVSACCFVRGRHRQPPETTRGRAQTGGGLLPPCSGSRAGEPFLAQREAVSPSMTVAATASRRPCSAQSAVLGRRISITASRGLPSSNSRRAALTNGDALTHRTRSPRRAAHFRPLGVGSITI
jgi:hypothetical protein